MFFLKGVKRDRNHLKFKDLIQHRLICISAVSDSAKSASARDNQHGISAVRDSAKSASALSETALMPTSCFLCKYNLALSPTALMSS
jgi:hypothetical protein